VTKKVPYESAKKNFKKEKEKEKSLEIPTKIL
jgi:hypothetical protein